MHHSEGCSKSDMNGSEHEYVIFQGSTSDNAYLNHFKAEMVHGAWQLMTTSMAT